MLSEKGVPTVLVFTELPADCPGNMKSDVLLIPLSFPYFHCLQEPRRTSCSLSLAGKDVAYKFPTASQLIIVALWIASLDTHGLQKVQNAAFQLSLLHCFTYFTAVLLQDC